MIKRIKFISKKSVVLMLSVLVMLQMFSGCATSTSSIGNTTENINVDTSEDAIENLTLSYSTELGSQNQFHLSNSGELNFMVNLYDGLMVCDNNNEIVPAVAASFDVSDDYKTWTFHLRDDSYWVNYKGEIMRRVTSDDFITGLEWVLNFGKNEGSSLVAAVKFVEGAQDYFDYTETLGTEEAKNLSRDVFLSYVNVEAPDENTIVYHLSAPCSYFDSVVCDNEFYPAPQDLIDEIGIDKYLINNYLTAWYNGPYVISEYIPNNERIIDANPHWYGNDDNTRFLSITYKMVSGTSIALQLYKNNELDYVDLYLSQVRSMMDKNSEYVDYFVKQAPSKSSYVFLFNFQKYKQDGSLDVDWNRAVANEDFRLSWYYGLDTYHYLKNINPITPYENDGETLNVENLATMSDGTDYVDLVKSMLDLTGEEGKSVARLNKDKFEEHKKKAIEVLSKQGVSFPIQADYYVYASSQSALDSALILKNVFSECFGDDYIQLNIVTYSASYSREVVIPQKYSFETSSWGADFKDPSSVLSQYLYQDDNAYEMVDVLQLNNYTEEELKGDSSYMKTVVDIFKTYNKMFESADSIVGDDDLRYEKFAEVEAYLINHGFIVPILTDRAWSLTKIDTSSKNYSAFGAFNGRMVNVKTNKNGYTDAIWEDE